MIQEKNINWAKLQRECRQVIITLPGKMGTVIVNFSKERFRAQAWADNSYQPWKARRRNGKKTSSRGILIKSGRLRRSIRIVRTTSNSVTVGSDVPYAQAHNEGFTGSVSVRGHKRHNMKRRQMEVKGKKRNVKMSVGEFYVKAHDRRMDLPQRQFMGESRMQRRLIENLILKEIQKVFK